MEHDWTCRCCGKQFNTILLDKPFKAPEHCKCRKTSARESLGSTPAIEQRQGIAMARVEEIVAALSTRY